jgi:hypothetical protein
MVVQGRIGDPIFSRIIQEPKSKYINLRLGRA